MSVKRWKVKGGTMLNTGYVFKVRKGESYGPGEEFSATEAEVEPQRAKVEEVRPERVVAPPELERERPRRKERARSAALREPPADRAMGAP